MQKTRTKIIVVGVSLVLSGFGLWAPGEAFAASSKEVKEARKREDREYKKMPKDARKALKKEIAGVEDVDYFTADEGGDKVFGARFANRDGKQIEVRVDEDGKLLHRGEIAAAAAPPAEAAPAAAATPAVAAPDSRPPQEVGTDDMPEAARRTVQKEVAGSRDIKLYRLFEQGVTSYHATYTTPKGENLRLYVAEDGRVLSLRNERMDPVATISGEKAIEDDGVELGQLPGPAQEQIRKLTEGSTNVRLYKAMFGKRPCYQAMFTNREGQYVSVRVDDSGQVLQTKVLQDAPRAAETAAARDQRDASVTLGELPEPVRAAVERETKGAKNVKLYRAQLGNQPVTNARFTTADGRDMSIRIDNKGQVVDSKQLNETAKPAKDPNDASLTFEQIPAGARGTIERETKGAKRVKYYKAKFGKQDVTEAEWTNADGKRVSLRVDGSGKVVDRKVE